VSSRRSLPKAPTPDRITEIQTALARGGYYQGDPNGKWDTNTVAAMQKFQSANGLDSTGKLDALSLQKLGLGSDIAGVSAPKPLTPPGPSASTAAPAASTAPGHVRQSPSVGGSSSTAASANTSIAASQ
jgi:peptidoglycan hydrolase-like protein with peptidoglycan-binding domain